jgi:thiol:disulfide interchange protein
MRRALLARLGSLMLAACGAAGSNEVPTVVLPPGPAGPRVAAMPPSNAGPGARRPAPPIVWEASESAARERARRAGLPLLVWIRADWDASGLEMERTTWLDPKVAEAARPFVALRLDVSAAEGDAQRYAERYEVNAVPMLVLFDAHGQRAASLTGYQNADRVVDALRRAAED